MTDEQTNTPPPTPPATSSAPQVRHRAILGFISVPLGVVLMGFAMFLGTGHGALGAGTHAAAATSAASGCVLVFVVGRRLLTSKTEL